MLMTRRCRNDTRYNDRGKIATRMAADLVLFDPTTIKDHNEYKSPDMPSAGINLVLVSGKPTWKMKHSSVQDMALFCFASKQTLPFQKYTLPELLWGE